MYKEVKFKKIKPLLMKYRITTLPYSDFGKVTSYINNNVKSISHRFCDNNVVYFPEKFKIGGNTGFFNTSIFSSMGNYSYS